jgi:Protein of unknown function (DUF2804)
MPLLRGGRPLKRWVWVGAFGPDVMLCAAQAWVGPVPVSWWAVWDRRALAERFVRRTAGWIVTPAYVLVPGVMELFVGGVEPVEVVSPHGSEYAWTRKQAGVGVRGWAVVDGRRVEVDASGVVDESAGYHARSTSWRWSAGVGVAAGGERVAWNLVDGLHDGAQESERAVWIDGVPRPVARAGFGGLAAVSSADGVDLRFTAEARRARRDRLLLVSSDYEQPFGTFAGELPGAGTLREGFGVMERHSARW